MYIFLLGYGEFCALTNRATILFHTVGKEYILLQNGLFESVWRIMPITVAGQSNARFASSNTGIVGSNPTQGMNVCVYSVCV
jgi:hypothetical protein